jgi:hypothetical protein
MVVGHRRVVWSGMRLRAPLLALIGIASGSCGGEGSQLSGGPASSGGGEAATVEPAPPAAEPIGPEAATVTPPAEEPPSGSDEPTEPAVASDPPADPPADDRALTRAIVRRLVQPIRDCYDRALARDPDVQLPGFEVETRPDGRMSARIVRSSGDRELDRCVVAAVRRVRVPAAEAPAATVTYPFAIQMED